ncbi:ribonuclease E activity regulator RraA [Herminiimonas sp. CN]|uniref:ribonuclease E activity regulator RraA n=1 Tax=Herminiimonas sp. CN TaxID=1349818 RepID=UPI0004733E75|nr:ribonuclease E activity regulator RraA [Herminiimonas sp. CN]
MTFATCDICDAHEDQLASGALAVLPPLFKAYGREPVFSGPAYTLKVFEDNALVRTALEQPGNGQVLVIDGGGSLRCALVGGNLAVLAVKNGWSGIVVNGCIRDSVEINGCAIGVRALATHPQKSIKKGVGDVQLRVMIAGVAVRPGSWIYADQDGVLVAQEKLI